MSVVEKGMMLKNIRNSIVAAALGLGMVSGAAEATPIAPGSMRLETIQSPIEEARVVVVHHHHRPRRVCWWSHGRRVCRWR
jgi:hypothetical protein